MERPAEQGEIGDLMKKNRLLNADFFIGAWIMLFGLMMLPNLNNAYPLKGDESFYTVSAMNMIQRGEPFAPYYFGAYRFNKPILPYLVVTASYHLFGVSMWSARLMMLAITCMLLFVTYRCAVQLFDNKKKAVLATLILSACYLCVGFARIAMTEPLLTLLTMCALYLYAAMFTRRSHLLLKGVGGALFTGLAFMTKGPVALLPLTAAVVYAAIHVKEGRGRLLWTIVNPLSIGVVVLVVVPWYMYIKLIYPAVLEQNLQVEKGALLNSFKPAKMMLRLFFYAGALLLVHIPFTAAAGYSFFKTPDRKRRELYYPLWFCGMFLFVFIFLVDMHKERYLTVIAPAVSIVVASYLYSDRWKKWAGIACVVSLAQIMVYNCYPVFSHEALRALVSVWRTEYQGTLGLPLDKKRVGWCRLYAHDNNIVPPEDADYLIVADEDRERYPQWIPVVTEKRLSSLHFRKVRPVVHYRIFHLLKRPDTL